MTKLVVETELLTQVVSALAPIVPKKSSRDILKCLLIKAETSPDKLFIYAASDHMETFASVVISDGVLVKKAGEFVVPMQDFFQYLKAIETDKVIIETEGDATARIKAGSDCFEIGLQDVEEFPDFPEVPSE